ncbi:MAG: PHP domain-containing protein [Cellulosilyticaceae bacterium]
MQLIDLHVHSTTSDGTLTPRELAFYAKAKGLSAIALTDHDTTSGVMTCIDAGKLVDLTVIPGIELTAHYGSKEIHVLGYYINPNHPQLLGRLEALVRERDRRNDLVLEKLQDLGLDITMADLRSQGDADSILTRAHFGRALLAKGYVASMDEAFSKYLSSGRPAYVPKQSMAYEECIALIHEAGGIAVIAHPLLYGFSTEELDVFLKDLMHAGLDGLEAIYAKYSSEESVMLLNFCLKYNLVPTGGSDFHGINKPNLEIGSGYGSLAITYDILEGLYLKQKAVHP